MATTYEIIQGLSQAASNAYDGALDTDGKPLKVGLRREEDVMMFETRTMDGFGVKFYGNKMCVHYHSECTLKEVIGGDFESEIEQRIANVASFLKKEYKKVTGNSISFSPEKDCDILVQNISRQRSFVLAKKIFEISSMEEAKIEGTPVEDKVTSGWDKFLSQGGLGTRPPNDKRPKNK